MKIWMAVLVLEFSEEENKYIIRFKCECDNMNYKENKQYKTWVNESFTSIIIPMEMKVSHSNCITQGFDYEPTQEEQNKIELNMKKLIRKELEYNKEKFLKEHEKKMKAIKMR